MEAFSSTMGSLFLLSLGCIQQQHSWLWHYLVSSSYSLVNFWNIVYFVLVVYLWKESEPELGRYCSCLSSHFLSYWCTSTDSSRSVCIIFGFIFLVPPRLLVDRKCLSLFSTFFPSLFLSLSYRIPPIDVLVVAANSQGKKMVRHLVFSGLRTCCSNILYISTY